MDDTKNSIVSIAASTFLKRLASVILAGALLKYGVFPFFEIREWALIILRHLA
jgi:hypothetical protein